MTKIISEFTFDDRDEYNRRPIAANIVKLLVSDIKVSPLVIDGSWGSGKTEFCHKLMNLLKTDNAEYETIYIDAFRADHANEPLMTLLAGILDVLTDEEGDSLLQKALPAIRYGAKTLLKAGVGWVLRQDASSVVDNFDEEIKKASNDAINHTIESALRDHVNANKSIETLREALIEVVSNKPIIIFVDELDRCRPDFAVSMLESIKHVFDVDGVQFVLITNSTQLKASINHCYGVDVDAQRYLDKFLGFRFTLPKAYKVNHQQLDSSEEHLVNLIDSNVILSSSIISEEFSIKFLRKLIRVNHLSLREVESLIQYFKIYMLLTDNVGLSKDEHFTLILLKVFGIFLFCVHPDKVKRIKNGIWDLKDIQSVLGVEQLHNLSSGERPSHFDFLYAVLGFDANTNNQEFIELDEASVYAWDKVFEQFFQRLMWIPEKGERTKIVEDIFHTLELS